MTARPLFLRLGSGLPAATLALLTALSGVSPIPTPDEKSVSHISGILCWQTEALREERTGYFSSH